ICLHAENYLNENPEMNFYQKLEGFNRLNELNDRAKIKTLHVSLNFSPSEKISDSKLVRIASDYMTKIGFGEQPFLVINMRMRGIRISILSARPSGKMGAESIHTTSEEINLKKPGKRLNNFMD
ncbi:MAG: hypothetical protein ABIW47_18120, partial [Ginsengibacter sp.]